MILPIKYYSRYWHVHLVRQVTGKLNNNGEDQLVLIKSFEIELKDIGAKNPIIIAFGNDCFKILNELKEKYTIFKVPHYSSCISKEQLREAFNEISKLL